METIFALATARGKSGVAVVRISGPEAFRIGNMLTGELPEPGRFCYRPIRGSDSTILDRGLVLTFRAPHSFTGEDVVELQVHGSVAVIVAVENCIEATGLARQAEAGEFTRRALLNERMDLGQVEALGDLIEAETAHQLTAAQRLMDGGLRELADDLRRDLLKAIALLEVTIDFADEDVPVDVAPDIMAALDSLSDSLSQEIEGSWISERLRDGFEVAILGAPNAGKSTLLNRIAGRDVAITSDIAGTTRDILEATVDLAGMPVTFLDTAGLRVASDEIERIGVDRAVNRAAQADLRVFLIRDENDELNVRPQEADIVVMAKVDLLDGEPGVSGLTGEGVSELMERIRRIFEQRLSRASTANRSRHRNALRDALMAVDTARKQLFKSPLQEEIVADELRTALGALDSLVGVIDVEMVLGEIFSEFCIGK